MCVYCVRETETGRKTHSQMELSNSLCRNNSTFLDKDKGASGLRKEKSKEKCRTWNQEHFLDFKNTSCSKQSN